MREDRLVVATYDDTGKLSGDTNAISSSLRPVAAPDRLAELVANVYHLLPENRDDEPMQVSRCGLIDEDGKALGELDPDAFHHVTNKYRRDAWHNLISGTAVILDRNDRSRPLDARPIPQDALDKAKEELLCVECFRQAVYTICWPEAPGKMTQEELRQFVRDWMDRAIFTDKHIHNAKDFGMVFMAAMLAPPMPEDYVKQIGIIYERMSQAGPRGINGNPCFMSFRVMHKDDWERVWRVIEREEERRAELDTMEI